MELTRKQKILLWSLIGAAVLIVAGLMIWIALSSASEPTPVEPLPSDTPTATGTPAASPTPTPSPTPPPTPYRLPLVPDGTAPTQVPSQPPAAQAEPTITVHIRADARQGIFTAEQKEFAAIGTRNGEAVAVLLVRVKPPLVTVLAIPCEVLAPVYTLGANSTLKGLDTAPIGTATARASSDREGCWNLIWSIKNLLGFQPPAWLCVDFACMESFFSFAPRLETETGEITLRSFQTALNETGEARARAMGALGIGAAQYLLKVSLWELPGFRSATRDAFTSSLSVLELFSLLRTMRKVTSFSLSVLPTEETNGVWVYTGTESPF